jgi:hypothetical protein
MKTIRAHIAQLVRAVKTVIVEVPDDFESWTESEQKEALCSLYDADDGLDFEIDETWGADEGTHAFGGEDSRPATATIDAERKASFKEDSCPPSSGS